MNKQKDVRIKLFVALLVFTLSVFLTGMFTGKAVYAGVDTSTQSAVEAIVKHYGYTGTIADIKGYNYIYVYNQSGIGLVNDYVHVYASKKRMYVYYNKDGSSMMIKGIDDGSRLDADGTIYDYCYDIRKNTIVYDGVSFGGNTNWLSVRITGDITEDIVKAATINQTCYANYDVDYGSLNSGTIFFYKAMTPILSPIMEAQGKVPLLSQVLAILPVLVGLMVGFLALRKALAMLRSLLSRA